MGFKGLEAREEENIIGEDTDNQIRGGGVNLDQKYIYTSSSTVSVPSWNWDPPLPLPQASVPPPPRNQRGGGTNSVDERLFISLFLCF